MDRLVVGIVGPIASGKGAISQFLQERGFIHFSLSDRIREECRFRGLTITRETLQDVGDELRQKFGNEELARRTISLINESRAKLVVVESIRNPGEIALLKSETQAFILGVTACRETRFRFLLERGRDNDPLTWEEFLRIDLRDEGINQQEHGQQVAASLRLADEIIENEGDLRDLRRKTESFLLRMGVEGPMVSRERFRG